MVLTQSSLGTIRSMSSEQRFRFISIAWLCDGGEEMIVNLDAIKKHCNPGRVDDLIADLAILCEDVELGRTPHEKLPPMPPPVPEGEITRESLEQEFAGWNVWFGLDNLWHARVAGSQPPVRVSDDSLIGLREEIIRKIGQKGQYWPGQSQGSRT
jgi:hypothetical protein